MDRPIQALNVLFQGIIDLLVALELLRSGSRTLAVKDIVGSRGPAFLLHFVQEVQAGVPRGEERRDLLAHEKLGALALFERSLAPQFLRLMVEAQKLVLMLSTLNLILMSCLLRILLMLLEPRRKLQ